MCNDNATVIIEPNEVLTTIEIQNECEEITIVVSGIGQQGLSAYQVAVVNGFVGTEEEWLDSLKAELPEGVNGQVLTYKVDEWVADWTWFQYASGFSVRPTKLSDSGGVKIYQYTYSFGIRYRKIDSTIDGFFLDLACTELIVKKQI